MMSKNLAIPQEAFPNFKLENLIDTLINTFYTNPAHQMKLILNLVNLPYQTTFQEGDFILNLNVTAVLSSDDS